jgi:hypothetical protein
MVKPWSSLQDLGSVVSRSIIKLIKTTPAVGWVRADELVEGAAAQELLRLRKQIDDLQARLQQSSEQPPQGAEDLASGDERYEIVFRTEFSDTAKSYTWEPGLKLRWNTIFQVLLPLMIDKATASELGRVLRDFARDKIEEKIMRGREGIEIEKIELPTASIRTIIVQLRALGLIVKDERQRSVRDTQTYWTLTPYGDRVMTRLNAIRSSSAPKVED